MSCSRNNKAVAKAAKVNGVTPESSQSAAFVATTNPPKKPTLGEILTRDSQNIRRLLRLKNSGEEISGEALARLLEMETGKEAVESLERTQDQFGGQAQLAVGKRILGIVQDTGEGNYKIQNVFVALPDGQQNDQSPLIKTGAASEQKNLQRLVEVRDGGESVSGDEVLKLLGMKLGQSLVDSTLIKNRFGDQAKLAFGEEAAGVVVETETGKYSLKEIFVPPPKEMGMPNEKVVLKPADRVRMATNINRVHEAIKSKKKVSVLYHSPKGVRYYVLTPLDVTEGRTEETRENKYLWLYSDRHEGVLSMRMDKVMWAKPNTESFDPAEVTQKIIKDQQPDWVLSRTW